MSCDALVWQMLLYTIFIMFKFPLCASLDVRYVRLLCGHLSIGGPVCVWHYIYISLYLLIVILVCGHPNLFILILDFKLCALWVCFYWPLYSLLSDNICDNIICDNYTVIILVIYVIIYLIRFVDQIR